MGITKDPVCDAPACQQRKQNRPIDRSFLDYLRKDNQNKSVKIKIYRQL
jgi:hypothetical protein